MISATENYADRCLAKLAGVNSLLRVIEKSQRHGWPVDAMLQDVCIRLADAEELLDLEERSADLLDSKIDSLQREIEVLEAKRSNSGISDAEAELYRQAVANGTLVVVPDAVEAEQLRLIAAENIQRDQAEAMPQVERDVVAVAWAAAKLSEFIASDDRSLDVAKDLCRQLKLRVSGSNGLMIRRAFGAGIAKFVSEKIDQRGIPVIYACTGTSKEFSYSHWLMNMEKNHPKDFKRFNAIASELQQRVVLPHYEEAERLQLSEIEQEIAEQSDKFGKFSRNQFAYDTNRP